jgi:hypothetical protein
MANLNHLAGRLAFCCLTVLAARAGTITNGGFELNDGANSFTGWTVAVQSGGQNNWWAQSGTNSPVNVFTVPAPPELQFAAMTDGPGPSSEALLQSFTAPLGAAALTLSFDYFILNPNSDFIAPDSLDFTAGANQQARVDILTAGAGAFDLDSAVVLNVLQTNPGDPNGTGATAYTSFSMDITASLTPGATYQLRFAEVDTQGQLLFGVDDVQINGVPVTGDPSPVPEPGSLLLAATGLLGLGWFGRRSRA